MKLVNETNQTVTYEISCDGAGPDCGTIEVDEYVELPNYDNQTNVTVAFKPGQMKHFSINFANADAGKQVEMAVVVGSRQQ